MDLHGRDHLIVDRHMVVLVLQEDMVIDALRMVEIVVHLVLRMEVDQRMKERNLVLTVGQKAVLTITASIEMYGIKVPHQAISHEGLQEDTSDNIPYTLQKKAIKEENFLVFYFPVHVVHYMQMH